MLVILKNEILKHTNIWVKLHGWLFIKTVIDDTKEDKMENSTGISNNYTNQENTKTESIKQSDEVGSGNITTIREYLNQNNYLFMN